MNQNSRLPGMKRLSGNWSGGISGYCSRPFVLRIARRFPLDRPHAFGHLLLHLPSAILFVIIHVTLFTLISQVLLPDMKMPSFLQAVMKTGVYELNFELGIIFYAVLVSIASAVSYYRIYQAEELTASQLEAQLTQTKFQALKAQIYPHFLFNTLSTICHLMKENVEDADRMIARLGDFLRLTMENLGTQEVALQRELAFLR